MLAGMSVDYYIRLERGNLSGASDSVLEALGRALKLDDAELAHLFDLARASGAVPRVRRRRSPQAVRPSVQRVLDAITAAPAWVRNDRGDVLAANDLGSALYMELMAEETTPPNSARFTFLNPKAREFFADWERAADDIVAVLRSTAGKNPYDKDLTDLIGELSTRSGEFRTRWARHDVKYHRTGRKRLHHSIVGGRGQGTPLRSEVLIGLPGLPAQAGDRRRALPKARRRRARFALSVAAGCTLEKGPRYRRHAAARRRETGG